MPSVSSPPSASSSATPIFDEVDRWWRDGGDDPLPCTMLSFAGSLRDSRRPVRVPAAAAGPRHLLARS
jgi:hypothetical protein